MVITVAPAMRVFTGRSNAMAANLFVNGANVKVAKKRLVIFELLDLFFFKFPRFVSFYLV